MFPLDSNTTNRPSPLTAPAKDSAFDEVIWVTNVSAWAITDDTIANMNIIAVTKVVRNFTNPPKYVDKSDRRK